MTNNGASSAFATWEQGTPAAHDAEAEPVKHQPTPAEGVSESRLSNDEREAAIARAGAAMEAAYAEFGRSGKSSDLERAYRHLPQMRELVRGRAPEVVARLEQERGLG